MGKDRNDNIVRQYSENDTIYFILLYEEFQISQTKTNIISTLNIFTNYLLDKTCNLKNNFKVWVIYFYLKTLLEFK